MTDHSVREPILRTANAENENINDRRNSNLPNGLDVVSDADAMFLKSLKKKNEERKKALETIYMSYDKLSTDESYMQIDEVRFHDSSSEDVGSPKGSKTERLNDAIVSMDYAAVIHLLGQGAGVDHPNKFGRCPLHTAILKGDYQMVKIILEAEADITLQDDRGDTPLHYAVRAGNELIVRLRSNFLAKIWRHPWVCLLIDNGQRHIKNLHESSKRHFLYST